MLIFDAEGFLSFFYVDEKRAIRMAIPSSTYSKGNYVLQKKSNAWSIECSLYKKKFMFNSIMISIQ